MKIRVALALGSASPSPNPSPNPSPSPGPCSTPTLPDATSPVWGTSTSDRSAHCWMSRLTFTLPVALALALDPNPNLNPNPNPNPNQGYEGHVGLEYKPSTQATAQSFAGWGATHGIA